MRRKFDITLEEYAHIRHVKQHNTCGICYVEFSDNHDAARCCIDHDHNTGKIRGLLCSQCSMGLGKFNDDYETLLSATLYIKGIKWTE